MGRIRFKENNSNCLTGKEDSTKNSDSVKPKRKYPRKSKENIAVGLHENYALPLKKDSSPRCVLSDKTNSVLNKITSEKNNSPIEKSSNSLWDENKIHKPRANLRNRRKSSTSIEPCHVNLNECTPNENKVVDVVPTSENKHVIPIYKQNETESKTKKVSLPVEEKLALYEFNEVDDPEESSAIKKKRKKRKYNKKKTYKIGPKYLTVNNIKYSSSESINSLTDKPLRRKPCIYSPIKKNKTSAVKRQSQSMINLNDSTNTCITDISYRSQPLSHTFCHDNSYIDLSEDEFHGFEEKRDNEQCQEYCNSTFINKAEIEGPFLSPIREASESCSFGFDEDEILEDSVKECSNSSNVVSDIKDKKPELPPQLSVQEIVQLLQAEQDENQSTNSAVEESTAIEPDTTVYTTNASDPDNDIVCSFTKPSRRSYQRQPHHRYSFIEKDHENNEEEHTAVQESKPHPKRKPKCKGKKEEAEMNKLAEMLNSKFEEVDKFSLCVE